MAPPDACLGSAPTPVPLSEAAELERQDQVAVGLARLLAGTRSSSADDSWALGLARSIAGAKNPQLDAWAEELEEHRCRVHLADFERCRSQHRLFSVNYAMHNDPALEEEEVRLLSATEEERQTFFDGIHKRIQRGDFSEFAFTQESFKGVMESVREARQRQASTAIERIQQLQELMEPCFRQRLGECAEALANFPFETLSGEPEMRWTTKVDALTLETAEDLWVVAEGSPAPGRSSTTEASAARAAPPAPAAPRDLLLVVDLSGSMCHVLPVLKECLHDVCGRVQEGDRVCIVGFSSQPKVLCEWTEISQGSAGQEARRLLQECVEGMTAKGGTCIVPALKMARSQLENRPPASEDLRRTAVVMLSDGDPEEPPEALSSTAARVFANSGIEPPLIVGLSLGKESRPDLMALLAQSGCGASLYIATGEQLPSQLGRMWGLLGGQRGASAGSCEQHLADAFVVMEPAAGVEIIEYERSPGGVVPLKASDGRQLVAMRCGRHLLPGDGSGTHRFAARLRLPDWARSRIGNSELQRPLLRTTWIWRMANQPVQATSETLRAVQVPSLLLEAKLGLPLRVHMAADASGIETFDRQRFLATLALALGVPQEKLVLGRLSPGSIIADLHLAGADASLPQIVHAACSNEAVRTELVKNGFEEPTVSSPGVPALRRVLQWKLAAALEAVASVASKGSSEEAGDRFAVAEAALASVVSLATSPAALALDPDRSPSSGFAAAVTADAEAALTVLGRSQQGQSDDGSQLNLVHSLEQQAHAHAQQLCPELSPTAVSVRCYEMSAMKEASMSFQRNAEAREKAMPPPAPVVSASETPAGVTVLHIFVEESGADATAPGPISAISAFEVSVHYGDRVATKLVPLAVGAAASPQGVAVELTPLEPGAEHAVVARALLGRSCKSEPSPPLLLRIASPCSGGSAEAASSPARSGAGRRTVRRMSSPASTNKNGVLLLEASATVLGTLSLSWEAPLQKTYQFMVTVEPDQPAQALPGAVSEEQARKVVETQEWRASFTGLTPSASYKFRIEAKAAKPEADPVCPSPPPSQARKSAARASFAGDVNSLASCISVNSLKGSAAPAAAAATPLRAVEGVVVVPPVAPGVLASIASDCWLRPFGSCQGVFTRATGGRGNK
eukprot:TRINITY_DN51318_c0_g1_i1.p1 TRINITY_DN51318_c0_g1~~TRINITY_DN51318_c0_g1_i1.p1  ORF type:complete len:1163 (-),score=250.41 TRINITY_DN51318_c0_g1_i1:112-3528(-)